MLWVMASFGFVFYFNRLPYALINYKGLGGFFLAYLIDYAYVLINYLYQLLLLSENEDQFNRLLCYFNQLLAYLLRVIHYISLSSPH